MAVSFIGGGGGGGVGLRNRSAGSAAASLRIARMPDKAQARIVPTKTATARSGVMKIGMFVR